jgi:PDZ domain-containing protein
MPSSSPGPRRRPRRRTLALCALPLAALLAVVALAPLPFTVAEPGVTANVLGSYKGRQVITVEGAAEDAASEGELRMVTIAATRPQATVRIGDVVRGWFATDREVLPRSAVYPVGHTVKQIERHGRRQMQTSQNHAVTAALDELGLSRDDVTVTLRLADVGGPSAGLLFTLGIVDTLGDNGDLTGGRTIAGTGTITADGRVGPVGGVPLKTQAAHRDGATVFLVPKAECADARSELPAGMRLVPVGTLAGALDALKALRTGGHVPHC